MRFDSVQFVGFCLLAVALLRAAKPGLLRDLVVAVLNTWFLYSFASDAASLVPLLLFVLAGYGAICVAEMMGTSKAIGLVLTIVIGIFVWLKRYSVVDYLPFLKFPYVTVGLSYILFRIIHLIVDVGQGALRAPAFLTYFNYVFFFLNYVSGPIQRFQDFSAQTTQPRLDKAPAYINSALLRIITGFFMVIVLCSFTASLKETLSKYFYLYFAAGLGVRTIALFACATVAQLIHLYINFAGYMHICIGIGRLAGYSLPENFDQPYKSKNFLDLWARWHITLSQWFKFYVFNPLMKALVNRWGTPSGQNTQYFAAIAFFVTFLAMGIWHGTTNVFIFYGLLLGSGVTINKIWQIQMNKRYGKTRYKALCRQAWYSQLSRASALSFFAVALTCIWIDPTQITGMATLRGMLCGTLACVVLTGLIFAILQIANVFRLPLRHAHSSFAISDTAAAVVTALKLFLLVNLTAVLGSGAPEFVYKAF